MITEQVLATRAIAPRVTLAALEQNIIAEHYFTAYEGRMGAVVEGTYESIGREAGTDKDLSNLKLLTFCVLVLDNGFTVHGVSACASPENYDQEIGRSIARKNAADQIWPLMGYELKTKLQNDEPIEFTRESAEEVARICHEANRSWCEMNGDFSQLTWSEAPQWQKDSVIAGVMFLISNPDAGDSACHDNWAAQKVAEGWIYGEIKDPEAKTHPCLVPFEELPHAQQFKDKLFRSIVRSSLNPTR